MKFEDIKVGQTLVRSDYPNAMYDVIYKDDNGYLLEIRQRPNKLPIPSGTAGTRVWWKNVTDLSERLSIYVPDPIKKEGWVAISTRIFGSGFVTEDRVHSTKIFTSEAAARVGCKGNDTIKAFCKITWEEPAPTNNEEETI